MNKFPKEIKVPQKLKDAIEEWIAYLHIDAHEPEYCELSASEYIVAFSGTHPYERRRQLFVLVCRKNVADWNVVRVPEVFVAAIVGEFNMVRSYNLAYEESEMIHE